MNTSAPRSAIRPESSRMLWASIGVRSHERRSHSGAVHLSTPYRIAAQPVHLGMHGAMQKPVAAEVSAISVQEARALRDWLNKALPDEKNNG